MITEAQAYQLIKMRQTSTSIGLDKRTLKALQKAGLVTFFSMRSMFSHYYIITESGLEALKEYRDAGKTAFGIKINLDKFLTTRTFR